MKAMLGGVEYGVVAVDGSAVVAGVLIAPGLLAHLPAGKSEIRLSPAGGRSLARFFVIGGVPFGERLLMWWNFVARSAEEITRAREDWAAGCFPPLAWVASFSCVQPFVAGSYLAAISPMTSSRLSARRSRA